ncbi:hypothetical protein V6N13_056180 [Hibiscus sabdariffa]|uniref:Uncharacterized protein n=1 Tax=Hibiscus sabdariffa TaxID=183260 RepID=A0ABR2BD60_9ROSI
MVVNDFRFKNGVGSGNKCVAFRMNAYRENQIPIIATTAGSDMEHEQANVGVSFSQESKQVSVLCVKHPKSVHSYS